MSRLIDKARSTIAAHDLLPGGAPVLAMVSGGADSVSLLRALTSGELGRFGVTVLHVDHQLRGAEAEADAAFVEQLCATLGVRCVVRRIDVAAYAAQRGFNLEDAGRRVRYAEAAALLDGLCRESGVPSETGRIVTAHTFDDRAETMLMRLAQGAGASGLLALPYRRGRIVRPLLDCARRDVTDYLTALGQDWREDATNADTSRLRARVRADVLPVLRDVNPRFDEAIARTLEVLGDEDEFLDALAGGAAASFARLERHPATGAPEIRIDRERAAREPRALLRRALRVALFDAFPESSRLEFEHLEALVDAMSDTSFAARDLPEGLRAHAEYGTLVISREASPADPLPHLELPVPGSVDIGDAGTITARWGANERPDADPMTALIDADALICDSLSAGPPRPGDRMTPLGMTGTRKLQDIFTDEKVPARERSRTPVVRDGDRIVWVAGSRLDEAYRVGPSTARTILLTWVQPT